MVQQVDAPADPVAVGQSRLRRPPCWRSRRSPTRPAVVVSDEQIITLVSAARALSERSRRRPTAVISVEARERLLRLDWAVRAGRLVLADRCAARALALATSPPTRAAQRWRVGL